MDDPSTSAAALKEEIARLTGAINRHKTSGFRPRPPTGYSPTSKPRNNVYVNPNYKPPSKPASIANTANTASTPRLPSSKPSGINDKRDVVIGGVAFESSGRSLVRKDLAQAKPKPPPSKPPMKNVSFARTKADAFVNASKMYKPKGTRRGRPANRNMTLNNTRRPYQPGARRRKYVERPCPRFTTTGACTRGLTCPYQHDPAKIAICWPFLQGNCPHTASTCPLSHDPTPERTPLCVHFANAGRCTRANCSFPHIRVGAREGVCRDFAVLGYCEKGLDCEHQHVRECPDFAEKGACTTKGCKLPHVIRANRNRLPLPPPAQVTTSSPGSHGTSEPAVSAADLDSGIFASPRVLTAEDGQLGDEFISLTFHESDSDEDDDTDDDDADSEGGEQVDEEGEDETSSLAVIHD